MSRQRPCTRVPELRRNLPAGMVPTWSTSSYVSANSSKPIWWDYGPKTIHYEALIADTFPGGKVPSPSTIARLLASVGHVEASPKKRPKSSYSPFARSTAMALWQLDAFEYTLTTGTIITIYQLLDDATRFDVGTSAHSRAENSADAHQVLAAGIAEYGAPKEVL